MMAFGMLRYGERLGRLGVYQPIFHFKYSVFPDEWEFGPMPYLFWLLFLRL